MAVVLAVLWIENLTFFCSHNLLFALSQELKKWNLARPIEELCFDIKYINGQEPLLQVLGKLDMFIYDLALGWINIKCDLNIVFIDRSRLVMTSSGA